MKINDVIKINGKLKILTGLHIGGEKESFKIGGVDNPVIKVLYNKSKKMLPYIPGSSLKGKIRYLLECSKDNNKTSLIKKLFGSTAKDKEESYGPTRLLFRDVYLTESSQNAEVTEIKPE
ncbi:MAG: type III-A CRISPR-associated RAMP protein Csm3, partial [Candidatus Bilamarchaeaceae archaeon]